MKELPPPAPPLHRGRDERKKGELEGVVGKLKDKN